MAVERLKPDLQLLSEEYVLIQAWKKTARSLPHNSFADTLALDQATVNLREFLHRLRERLQSWERWENKPLRMVPAPKSQHWCVGDIEEEGSWKPKKDPESEDDSKPAPIRPLAEVDLEDQVIATAVMLCLADRVETRQGDSRNSTEHEYLRKQVISYGNRLFCDVENGQLRHRWGSTKLYRTYFQDYRTFLRRPEDAAQKSLERGNKDVYLIYSDLKQFFDRVRPELITKSIEAIREEGDDEDFFSFLHSLLNWQWDDRDAEIANIYAEQARMDNFECVTLPQGLVASGFFANLVLLSFDEEVRGKIGEDILKGVSLVDVCRYVDDLRIVIAVDKDTGDSDQLKKDVSAWLKETLGRTAPCLEPSDDKTKIKRLGDQTQPQLRQRVKMNRIQSAISGGFDAHGGEDILDAIQGLLRAHRTLNSEDSWALSPESDVPNDTVARFAAGRYRKTFRSIRPLLQDEDGGSSADAPLNTLRSQSELDQEAKAFAYDLVERWIRDPSHARLLRIGLDIWPGTKLLEEALSRLRPYTKANPHRPQNDSIEREERVAWYCLSEIFRAGATETGIVPDDEPLPPDVCIESYREALYQEAENLIRRSSEITLPWYLLQQALLFLAVYAPDRVSSTLGTIPDNRKYLDLIRFLRSEKFNLSDADYATLSIQARRSLKDSDTAILLAKTDLTPTKIQTIAERDPAYALELLNSGVDPEIIRQLPEWIRQDLCWDPDERTLAKLVTDHHPHSDLRNEYSLLHFAKAFLLEFRTRDPEEIRVITPGQVTLTTTRNGQIKECEVQDLRILPAGKDDASASIYALPSWCKDGDRWRIQLGFLLRFILSGQPDFTQNQRPAHYAKRKSSYRRVTSHWYQRSYGLYHGHSGFGDDWVAISNWFEEFLQALLHWPGCRYPQKCQFVRQGIDAVITKIEKRIRGIKKSYAKASQTLILPLKIDQPIRHDPERSFRACMVQTVIPSFADFKENADDLTLGETPIRQKHRRHLSSTLAAVNRALMLRDTHSEKNSRLDLLILPELAVHPKDVYQHLIPFARAHKTMILAGLTYEEAIDDRPLINSALWIIPKYSEAYGLQITVRRQGKQHVSEYDLQFNGNENEIIQKFCPCQWYIIHPWSLDTKSNPLRLTAAVGYNGEAPGLTHDVTRHSDILAIPALNGDVTTLRQMTKTLHEDRSQCVITVNNGEYGGSNAFIPIKGSDPIEVFHMHGQPQVGVLLLEIEDMQGFLDRKNVSASATIEEAMEFVNPPNASGSANTDSA